MYTSLFVPEEINYRYRIYFQYLLTHAMKLCSKHYFLYLFRDAILLSSIAFVFIWRYDLTMWYNTIARKITFTVVWNI